MARGTASCRSRGTRSPARPRTTSGSARSRAAATSRRTARRSPARRSRSRACRTPPRRTSSSRRTTRAGNASALLERGPRPAALRDRLGQPPVAADDDPHDQHHHPDRHGLRPGLDRRRHVPARRHAGAARAAGLRPRRVGSRRERGVDLGRRRVQHGRRQQRRVQGIDAAGIHRLVRLRLALLDDRRPRLGLRGPRRHRQRVLARASRGADGQPVGRRHRARDADRAGGHLRLAGRHRAGVGRGHGRPDPVRVRAGAVRHRRGAVGPPRPAHRHVVHRHRRGRGRDLALPGPRRWTSRSTGRRRRRR